jgi:hypothetical protein
MPAYFDPLSEGREQRAERLAEVHASENGKVNGPDSRNRTATVR